jgi:hypothetical protein
VPYRDRERHLDRFLPHLAQYFARDKLDADIPYLILIVDQSDGLPFNRGALLNAGFLLCQESCDYVCFHDVGFLPIWADYSNPRNPAAAQGRSLTRAGEHNYTFNSRISRGVGGQNK